MDLTAAEEKEEAEVTTAEEKEEAEVITAEEKEEVEVATIAAAETAVTNDVIAPRRENEKKAKENSEAVVDKIRKEEYANDKLASQPFLSNKLNDFM